MRLRRRAVVSAAVEKPGDRPPVYCRLAGLRSRNKREPVKAISVYCRLPAFYFGEQIAITCGKKTLQLINYALAFVVAANNSLCLLSA